jgi:hypothetical protein
MQRKILLTCLGFSLIITGFGQIKKQFTVEDAPRCEDIKLCLKANSGNCFIKPGPESDILNVFSNQTENAYSHNFKKEVKGKTCDVMLQLEEAQAEGVGQNISTRFFGAGESASNDKIWKMYLTESKPYDLELNYGVGNAHIDLSGLSIRKLKINTASADVTVGYFSALENQLDMDTFSVKVDVGSINVKDINLSKPRHVVADVGFGSMILDFTSQPLITSYVSGSVGAGNLTILLPMMDVPVLVRIKDSWLCSVKMPSTLKKLNDTTFASATYSKGAKNALIFDLDVSMGNIIFKNATSNK